MKTSIFILVFLTVLLTACEPLQPISQPQPPNTIYTSIVRKYTTIDKVLALTLGMTKAQVVSTLDLAPDNILIDKQGSGSAYIWFYKKNKREVPYAEDPPKQEKFLQDYLNQKSGNDVYLVECTLYCFFNTDGKLETIISDEGLAEIHRLQIKLNQYEIIKNKKLTELFFLPDTIK